MNALEVVDYREVVDLCTSVY